MSEKLRSLWDRLKKIKHIEIYIAAIVALIIVAVYLTSCLSSPQEKTKQEVSTEKTETFSSSQEYGEFLENKLCNVLASVKGAGNVKVALTLEGGFEYIYLTSDETKTSADGGEVVISTPVLIDGKPVLEKEIYPKLKGIVVTATGANDVSVRLHLLEALQTVVEVDSQNITILAGN